MQTMRLVLTLVILIQTIICITTPSTTVYIKYFDRVVDGVSYPSYQVQGSGPNWQDTGAGIYGLVFPGSGDYSLQVVNQLEEQTILHAHGLLPPSTQDGVPYFSAVPIFPQRSQVYQFALNNQNGTYFLHSHFGFQLGNGLTIPLIISGNDADYPLYSELEAAYDSAILLEDICASTTIEYDKKLELAIEAGLATPRQDINRNGPRQKGDCSSWATFLKLAYVFNTTGGNQTALCPGLVPATDSDVFYEKYLLNGQTYESPRVVYKSDLFDSPIRIRFINSAGMTNFQLVFPFSVTLVATDGLLVEPFANNTFWIAVAQRLDVLVQVPEGWGEYFNVTAYTENTEKSIPTVIIYSIVELSGSQANGIGTKIASVLYIAGMMDNLLDQTVQAFKPLPAGEVTKQLDISLTGDNGFRGINNHSYRLPPTGTLPYVPNEFPLLVSYGDRVRMVIQNFNIDSHPMHLHGHVFQIVEINGKSINGPMRDVALVPGGCNNVTLEFEANNPGVWAFHCHLEFHSAAGMLTTLEYTT